MTTREQELCKAILKAAHEADGMQIEETALHASAHLITAMTLAEFTAALALCDQHRWLTGVTSRLNRNRRKWNINDAGEAALTEL